MDKRIDDDRMKHMHGVAEYAYAHAEEYGLDVELMYILGLLHDIGRIRGGKNHEKNGAELMAWCGYIYANQILYHGYTPSKYFEKFGKDADINGTLVLLWEADLMVDTKGNLVGFDARLEDIGKRYGTDSDIYAGVAEKIKWLKANMSYYKLADEQQQMLNAVFKD